ncbi:MAG: MFS transporter [Planctomycetes bacterium]|nr:MFS transporter [Planctomycetota bacterium]
MEGRASARVVTVLALVFALSSADLGAIGAMALQLNRGLGIGATEIGLLLTASSLVGAIATLPFGWLVDRTNRTRMLALTVVLWGVAMGLSAAAMSYFELLLTRLALGAMIAVSVPAVASLVGDYFQPQRRGRIYGYILAGELVGTGFGYVVSGELALLSWRIGFLGLALPAFWVAWLVYRLPEPARGGADWLEPGQERIGERRQAGSPAGSPNADVLDTRGLIQDLIREAHIEPRPHLVEDRNPARWSLLEAAWYILRIPTNVVLVIASALGYYFFAGMQTFGVVFAHGWFGLAHSAAIGLVLLFGASGLAGALAGGRVSDRLLARRHLTARITVTVSAYLGTAVFLLAFFAVHTLRVAVPALMLAGFSLGAANPPLDAARLDIMHPYLWGRAEAVRVALRQIGEALGPVLFGYAAEHVFGGGPVGLERTFLVMLVPLFVSGGIAFLAFGTYPRDVATAYAYAQRTLEKEKSDKP